MIASMTAFSRKAIQLEFGSVVWECRSVNHRFLDLNFKIPDDFRQFELDWRNLVNSKVSRGKVECFLTVKPGEQADSQLKLNLPLAKQVLDCCQEISEFNLVSNKVKPLDLLRWPQMVQVESFEVENLKQSLTQSLSEALDQLVISRHREGSQILGLLKDKSLEFKQLLKAALELAPKVQEQAKQKLIDKISELKSEVDPHRLEQELVYYAQRMDVTEELDRLQAHYCELERGLEHSGPIGRKLDFTFQEMGREANTLAAKSSDAKLNQIAVELKLLIEKLREQIQNVE